MLCKLARRAAGACVFASAARRYWLDVFPTVRREMRHLHLRARGTSCSAPRRIALHNLRTEAGNLEGAAAFATFTARTHRASIIRAQVTFQAAYDYVDSLTEQPGAVTALNARRLHSALVMAVTPDASHLDYYGRHIWRDDGGYLVKLVNTCREAIRGLPSFPLVAGALQTNARRIVAYQSRINALKTNGHSAFARWAGNATPADIDLRWWETGAACGSSLAIFALLAAAGDAALTPSSVSAIDSLYWPWAGALHTLLDSLIDHTEDIGSGQHSLITHYTSVQEMIARLRYIAINAIKHAEHVGEEHRLMVAGMASLYLSDPQARQPHARLAAEAVQDAFGSVARPAISLLRLRRLAAEGWGI